MISIKKHMDEWSAAQRIHQAYQSLMDRFLKTALDRIPAKDASAGRALRGAVAAANEKLKAAGDAEALERAGVELIETLGGGWDDAAAYFVERERGLTEIISLLARTAEKLDASNRNFYSNLYQSVEALEKVGSIDDISALRKALGEHLHRIEDMVNAQEQVSAQGFQALQKTLESAKTKAETISRLVTAAPLTSLPSRRHGEQLIGDLLAGRRGFSLGIVSIERLASVERRYGAETTAEILRNFSSKLRETLPPKLHLYHWGEAVFVAVGEGVDRDQLRQELSAFLRDSGSQPFPVDPKGRRTETLDPKSVVYQVDADGDAAKVGELIARFSSTTSAADAR